MKTMRFYSAALATTALLGVTYATTSFGDATPSAPDSDRATSGTRVYHGNVTSVDVPDHILTVRNFLFTRNFALGRDCKVTLQDKPKAELADLHPGQDVDVRYDGDHGVYIARVIAQHNLAYSGHITSIDVQHNTILVRHAAMTREFAVAPNCDVMLRGNKASGLNNLQVGDAVTVVYERAHGSPIVRRIEQNSATFTGNIEAVDLSTRTVKMKGAKGERQFNLENNCAIVINGQWNNSMDKLAIGERAQVNYNNVDGVLVANRISPMLEPAPAAPPPAQTAQQPSTAKGTAYNSYNN